MQSLNKVEDYVELRKDKENGAILLADHNIANEYKSKKAMMSNVRGVGSELNMIKEKLSEIDTLKEDMKEIKELLRGLAK
jgi:hypothetical protein